MKNNSNNNKNERVNWFFNISFWRGECARSQMSKTKRLKWNRFLICNSLAERNRKSFRRKREREKERESERRGEENWRGTVRSLVSVPEGSAAAAPRWSMSPLSAIWTMSRCLGPRRSLFHPLSRRCALPPFSFLSPPSPVSSWAPFPAFPGKMNVIRVRKGRKSILIYYSSGDWQAAGMRVRESTGRGK